MISEELRIKLIEKIKTNPKEAIKELEKDPKILELLLKSASEEQKTKQELSNERTKYVNMTESMQRDLRQKAEELRTTQGLLIGAGVLLLLALLENK